MSGPNIYDKLQILAALKRSGVLDDSAYHDALGRIEADEQQARDTELRPSSAEKPLLGFSGVRPQAVSAMERAKEPPPMPEQSQMLVDLMVAGGGVAVYAARTPKMKRDDRPEFDMAKEEVVAPDDPSLVFPDLSQL